MPETPALPTPDPNTVRLPWPFQAAAVLGVAIPIGMLAHLGHRDQQALGQEVETLGEQNVALTAERDSLATEVVEFDAVRDELSTANASLEAERGQRVALEGEVAGLKSEVFALKGEVVGLNEKVVVLGEREEALRGIIDLLEGEVVSAERRLAKLTEQRPTLAPELKHLTASAIVASNDPQLRHENERLRNELRKHDEQVVELLGEISALNQEIEIIREQSGKLRQQANNNDAGFDGAALAGVSGEE